MSPAPEHARDLEAAFTHHYAFVRERLRCLGVAAADLDDATQDVFEILVRRISDYDPERPLRAWMAGIARRVARRYRDRGRRLVVPLDERLSPELSPEQRAARAEAWRLLERFIAQLEPERWTVFVLSELEGLRGSEIAAELGVNQNTVYARLRSAKAEFERTLRRHRARERRGLRAVWIWPASRRWSFAGSFVVLGGLALGSTMLVLGGTRCGVDEDSQSPSAALEAMHETPARGSEVRARPSDPANSSPSRTPHADPEGWHAGGGGFANSHDAAGQAYALEHENRYRLAGDRVIFERSYIGDEHVAIDSIETRLTPDGLELVAGELEWTLSLDPGETKVVSVTLRATREGVVSLEVGSGGGSRSFKWMFESGELRPCGVRECEAPKPTRESLSGERIRVHVHNQCEVVKEFVLFAGYPEQLPPDSATIYALQPDEHRTMEIDAAQWFLHRDAEGHIGGGVQIDEDGASVTFSGTGDDCSSASARSPNLPPGPAGSLPPVELP